MSALVVAVAALCATVAASTLLLAYIGWRVLEKLEQVRKSVAVMCSTLGTGLLALRQIRHENP